MRPPRDADGNVPLCWRVLEADACFQWIELLGELSDLCVAAALKRELVPLPPFDSTLFHSKLSLLLRALYERAMECQDWEGRYRAEVDEQIAGTEEGSPRYQELQRLVDDFHGKRVEEVIKKIRKQ